MVSAPALILASVTAFAFTCAAWTALSATLAFVTASSAIFAVVIELSAKLPEPIEFVGIELPVCVILLNKLLMFHFVKNHYLALH